MTFRLLGPLEVRVGSAPVRIASPKQQTTLAMLLVHAGRAVTVPELTAEVWDANPPPSAVGNLRSYIMQLRRQLASAGEWLRTSRLGYLLQADENELDLLRFRSECTRARESVAGGDLLTADQAFGNALALWRGRAVEDVHAGPKLRAAAEQLTEQRLAAALDHADVRLALGRHAAVVRSLRELAEQYPLRERVHRQLMLALYRHGDVAGALEVFARVRDALAERLHLDPGPDLVWCQQAILRRDATLALAGPPGHERPRVSRPRQLIRPPHLFAGRAGEFATVERALRAPGPAMVLVHGPAGVGKSAFALRAAHGLARHFPDGQLYADLQGTSPELAQLAPAEVLRRFVRALGTPPERLPADVSGGHALFHSLLAGRRMLVVLDNATDAAQVTPMLPMTQGCAALITSRAPLPVANAVALDVLDEPDSLRLLSFTAGLERITAEPAAAVDIVRWCGRHPLALRIAGARLAARPDWTLARFAERLRPTRRRLDELRMDDLSVRSYFDVGYRRLGFAAARAFRGLGVRDVPAPALAQDLLGELGAAGLLTRFAAGRFHVHELSRLYAAELAAAARQVAV
jgi:DNA-binding SARP family transcriptional activator